MMQCILANGDLLPEWLEFLTLGWWIVHIVGAIVVFSLGCMCGKKCAAKCAPKDIAASAPAEPEAPADSGEGEGGEGV